MFYQPCLISLTVLYLALNLYPVGLELISDDLDGNPYVRGDSTENLVQSWVWNPENDSGLDFYMEV